MSLPGRKLSLFNTEIASNVAASDLLVALIGAPKANKNITFAGVIQAGFRLLSAAVVNTVHLIDEAVTTGKIADGAVTADKLASNSVTSGKIASSAVTTAKINDGAVTSGKLGGSAVTTAKIKDGDVTTIKLTATERLSSVSHWANSSTPSVGAVALIYTTSSLTVGGTVSGSSHTQAFINIDSSGGSSISSTGTTLPGMYRVMALVARFPTPSWRYAYLAQRIS